jgi:LacI family transcriptional regulator
MKLNRKAHVTLSDIAKQLNVSKVTVSKTLRGDPDSSRETTKLVRKTARKLDYNPNFAARNLSSRKSNTIGFVVPRIAHFFFGSVIEPIYDQAFNNNYDIVLTVLQENAEPEKKTLMAMRIDGLIVSVTQATTDSATYEKVMSRSIPLVFMDRALHINGRVCW